MRAALLPTPGDPFVVSYWAKNFERVWMNEVDELHVMVNGGSPDDVQPVFDRLADVKASGRVVVQYESCRIGHGEALRALLGDCPADEIVLVEDDAYVRRPGAVTMAFEWRRPVSGLVLASPRGGMSPELAEAAQRLWGNSVGPDTSVGHGMWPCFLFADRVDLVSVQDGFPALSWPVGSVVPGIDYQCEAEMHTDTFTAAAFMLRATRPVIPVSQHKELWQKRIPEDQEPPWFHAGGLSNFDPYQGGAHGARQGIGGTNEGLDWAHRIWWWRRCLDTAPPKLDDLKDGYRAGLEALVEETGISDQVSEWDEVYRRNEWITWDERSE